MASNIGVTQVRQGFCTTGTNGHQLHRMTAELQKRVEVRPQAKRSDTPPPDSASGGKRGPVSFINWRRGLAAFSFSPASAPSFGRTRVGDVLNQRVLGGLVALALIALVVSAITVLLTADRSALLLLTRFPPGLAAAAAALTLVPWVTNALRNRIWARFFGVELSFMEALRISLAVELGCAATPTAGGGGYLKLAMLMRRGLAIGPATCLMTLATLENGVFLCTAVPLVLLAAGGWQSLGIAHWLASLPENVFGSPGFLALPAVALVAVAAVRVFPPVRIRVALTLRSIRRFVMQVSGAYGLVARAGRRQVAQSVALAGIGYSARYAVVSLVVVGLGERANPLLHGALQWVVFLTAGMVPTPGGIGAAEAAFLVAYSPHLNGEVLGVAVVLWRFFTFYLPIAIGATLLMILITRKPEAI
jgi:uncharacterized membrane protein YbhN (UPF0104 family)